LMGVEEADGRTRLRLRSTGGTMVVRSAVLATTGQPETLAAVEELLAAAQTGFVLKDTIYRLVAEQGAAALNAVTSVGRYPLGHLAEVHDYDLATPELVSALTEILAD
ncbi:MAG: glycoside hydrolase, partial [Acidipropionibacterium jensenii]|nr:glycoside hydrolase [Acidipropionibacterium jensenii]